MRCSRLRTRGVHDRLQQQTAAASADSGGIQRVLLRRRRCKRSSMTLLDGLCKQGLRVRVPLAPLLVKARLLLLDW